VLSKTTLSNLFHDVTVLVEQGAVDAWFKLPARVRHLFVMSELGHLTAFDPRLHSARGPDDHRRGVRRGDEVRAGRCLTYRR
jgi:hypothetical protein